MRQSGGSMRVCGVKNSPDGMNTIQLAELSEMREMLKLQQEQFNQLTQRISVLQCSSQHSQSPHRCPIICTRCQQPCHFARDCDGVRVQPSSPLPAPRSSRKPYSMPVSEN